MDSELYGASRGRKEEITEFNFNINLKRTCETLL